jgi:hypothetical protein
MTAERSGLANGTVGGGRLPARVALIARLSQRFAGNTVEERADT